MENNKNMRDLYELYLELGHDVFEERIKKPMELYMHANGNVINMNALNTIVANAMENSKLGEAGFDEHDLFSPASIQEKIYFDDTLPPMWLNPRVSKTHADPTMCIYSIRHSTVSSKLHVFGTSSLGISYFMMGFAWVRSIPPFSPSGLKGVAYLYVKYMLMILSLVELTPIITKLLSY